MIILLYFDWIGSVTELKEFDEKINKSCKRVGVKCDGLYGPMNQKWNYVWMFETETYEKFLEMARQLYRHPKMPHHIIEVLMPQ